MKYFVFAPNGQRYGPADLPTLQQWASEGRILPTTVVEHEQTLAQMPASAIPGLIFPFAETLPGGGPTPSSPSVGTTPRPDPGIGFSQPYQPTPFQSNYYRSMPQDLANAKDVTNSWICLVAAILCCAPLTIAGIVFANRAKGAGNPQAQAPLIANIVYTCLWGAGCLFYLGFFGLALLTGGFS